MSTCGAAAGIRRPSKSRFPKADIGLAMVLFGRLDTDAKKRSRPSGTAPLDSTAQSLFLSLFYRHLAEILQ